MTDIFDAKMIHLMEVLTRRLNYLNDSDQMLEEGCNEIPEFSSCSLTDDRIENSQITMQEQQHRVSSFRERSQYTSESSKESILSTIPNDYVQFSHIDVEGIVERESECMLILYTAVAVLNKV